SFDGLLVEEQDHPRAQPGTLLFRQRAHEWIAPGYVAPQRIVESGPAEYSLPAPFCEPAHPFLLPLVQMRDRHLHLDTPLSSGRGVGGEGMSEVSHFYNAHWACPTRG